MNLLTELLLAILISALLAVNTVVQTNQQTILALDCVACAVRPNGLPFRKMARCT